MQFSRFFLVLAVHRWRPVATTRYLLYASQTYYSFSIFRHCVVIVISFVRFFSLMFNDLAFFVDTVAVILGDCVSPNLTRAVCERKKGARFKWKCMQNRVSLRNYIFNTDRCPIRNESGWKKIDNNRFPNCEFPRFFTLVDVIILSAFRSFPHFYGGHIHMGIFFTIPKCDEKNSKQKKSAQIKREKEGERKVRLKHSAVNSFCGKVFLARTQTAEPFEPA